MNADNVGFLAKQMQLRADCALDMFNVVADLKADFFCVIKFRLNTIDRIHKVKLGLGRVEQAGVDYTDEILEFLQKVSEKSVAYRNQFEAEKEKLESGVK